MAASVLTTLERMTQSYVNPVVGGEILLGGSLGCPQSLLVVGNDVLLDSSLGCPQSLLFVLWPLQ